MLEKVSQLAEQAATSVSRRQFLGRIGKGSAAAAAALAGLLVLPAATRAGRGGGVCTTESVGSCRGLPVNSPCIVTTGVEGRCAVTTKVDGVWYCHCRVPGPKRGPRR